MSSKDFLQKKELSEWLTRMNYVLCVGNGFVQPKRFVSDGNLLRKWFHFLSDYNNQMVEKGNENFNLILAEEIPVRTILATLTAINFVCVKISNRGGRRSYVQ